MPKPGVWHTYIVEAENGSWYTGISTDVQKRFEAHQSGKGGKYFKISAAKRIVVSEKVGEYPAALRREAQIKKLTRKEKEKYAKNPKGLEKPGEGAAWYKPSPKKKRKKKKRKGKIKV